MRISRRLWWLPLAVAGLFAVACGDDSEVEGSTGGHGASSSSGTGGSSSSGTGGSAPSMWLCLPGCNTASDCDLNAGPAWDADNYDCIAGGCVYAGCNSNSECTSIGSGYICDEL